MFTILYQDEYLIAIDKPSGWLVHRSWLDKNEKVVVMQTLRDQIGQHVFPVHRLDRPTSGVLLFALSSNIARQMSGQFSERQPHKTYHAIVRGYIHQGGTIDYPLVEEQDKIADKFSNKDKPAQEAISQYKPISQIELPIAIGKHPTARYSFIELIPHTGRKHQLRRHMKHIYHPIIGDSKHGDLHQNRAFATYFSMQRLMLHSSELRITHPVTSEPITIKAPLDDTWLSVLTHFNSIK